MGQKHNRRRTRARPRRRLNQALPTPVPPYPPGHHSFPAPISSVPGLPYPALCAPQACMPAQRGPYWHTTVAACGSSERRPHNAMTKLESERCRLFGGEPGDDEALCYRMLEYFGGLDYIDT